MKLHHSKIKQLMYMKVREDIEKRLPDFSKYVDPQKAESCTGFKLPVCVRWQADFLQGGSVCREGFPRLCMGFNSEVFDQPSHQVVRVYIRLCLRPEIAEPTPKAGVSAGMWKLLRQMRTSSCAGASGNVLEERAEAPAKPESRLICMEGILMLDLGLRCLGGGKGKNVLTARVFVFVAFVATLDHRQNTRRQIQQKHLYTSCTSSHFLMIFVELQPCSALA